MRHLFLTISISICWLFSLAQNDIFILVDVSKSIKPNELNNGIQAMIEVLAGSTLSRAALYKGNLQDLNNFKLQIGDRISISKFGNLRTSMAINPMPTVVKNPVNDASQLLNSIPLSPTDNETYLRLAKAKIAEYAKNHNISNYNLYIISDNIDDHFGTGGKPNYPDTYTRDLADSYNTTGNIVNEKGWTKINFPTSTNLDFTLSFSPVDVSRFSLPVGAPPITTGDNVISSIVLNSPPKAKRGNEYKIESENLNIVWSCSNTPKGGLFSVKVSSYEGGKFSESRKDLSATSTSIKIPRGKFKITVTAQNFTANSDTTCVYRSSNSAGWLIALSLLAVAGVVGYYYWNKRRQAKIEFSAAENSDDIFSQGKGTSTTNSSNSDYF